MKTIEDQIIEVLATQLKLVPDGIEPDMTFESLDIDSLVIVELGLLLDGAFDIAIDDGELTNEMTIRDAARLVETKQAVA
ncbi:acyl carrier protein [Micromonospora schwarzwaldensis]|uniref:acyl carrier protein n=1 Tax=Micromonospora sp. DSM 45708 TaxID=3111767 RepID=UPI0031D47D02